MGHLRSSLPETEFERPAPSHQGGEYVAVSAAIGDHFTFLQLDDEVAPTWWLRTRLNHAVILPAQARISLAKASGCSVGGKWPPRECSRQCIRLHARSTRERGGAGCRGSGQQA